MCGGGGGEVVGRGGGEGWREVAVHGERSDQACSADVRVGGFGGRVRGVMDEEERGRCVGSRLRWEIKVRGEPETGWGRGAVGREHLAGRECGGKAGVDACA